MEQIYQSSLVTVNHNLDAPCSFSYVLRIFDNFMHPFKLIFQFSVAKATDSQPLIMEVTIKTILIFTQIWLETIRMLTLIDNFLIMMWAELSPENSIISPLSFDYFILLEALNFWENNCAHNWSIQIEVKYLIVEMSFIEMSYFWNRVV